MNNLIALEAEIPVETRPDDTALNAITYSAIESNHPVKYVCLPHGLQIAKTDRIILRSELLPARFLQLETNYERPVEEYNEFTFVNLINEFGGKAARENIKKRDIQATTKSGAMHFNIENQLLPRFNKDTSNALDIYQIEDLFQHSTIDNFCAVESPEDLCPLVKHEDITPTSKPFLIAIDCLYKYLSLRNIKERSVPSEYKFFYQEIGDSIFQGRLSPLAKDRLVIKLYILLLMVNNYKVPIMQLPTFNLTRSKIVVMLKSIGCRVAGDGFAVLVKAPSHSNRIQ